MGGNSDAASSFLIGKAGLALSGGGFRASLFHIGVLARLAELDVLRHVEVFSCVSGGSIVGAVYYLELRKKLQAKSDGELQQSDYIEIVQNLEKKFLAGVQRNIRLLTSPEKVTSHAGHGYRARAALSKSLNCICSRLVGKPEAMAQSSLLKVGIHLTQVATTCSMAGCGGISA